jgi:hypothetical protein
LPFKGPLFEGSINGGETMALVNQKKQNKERVDLRGAFSKDRVNGGERLKHELIWRVK